MLPNFGAMQEGLGAIIALIERIAVALERIAASLEHAHAPQGMHAHRIGSALEVEHYHSAEQEKEL